MLLQKGVQLLARRDADRRDAVNLSLHGFVLFPHFVAAFGRIQSDADTNRDETFICVVLPQQQAVLRARVIMRYGSFVPRVTRSSISVPM